MMEDIALQITYYYISVRLRMQSDIDCIENKSTGVLGTFSIQFQPFCCLWLDLIRIEKINEMVFGENPN